MVETYFLWTDWCTSLGICNLVQCVDEEWGYVITSGTNSKRILSSLVCSWFMCMSSLQFVNNERYNNYYPSVANPKHSLDIILYVHNEHVPCTRLWHAVIMIMIMVRMAWLHNYQHATQHNTIQYNTTQHNTTQHSTAQHSTTQQHNTTTQHNTIR